jgi:crotonobetainyl-CoA:carnitine CoA-transferase CaiB-like acyl-CoA transferase
MATRPEFYRNRDRVQNRELLERELTEAFSTGTVEHWCVTLKAHGVPVSPIKHLDEIYDDPHTEAIGMIGTVDHHTGPLRQIGFPVNFGGVRPPMRSAPPRHGEHTDEVLGEYVPAAV